MELVPAGAILVWLGFCVVGFFYLFILGLVLILLQQISVPGHYWNQEQNIILIHARTVFYFALKCLSLMSSRSAVPISGAEHIPVANLNEEQFMPHTEFGEYAHES